MTGLGPEDRPNYDSSADDMQRLLRAYEFMGEVARLAVLESGGGMPEALEGRYAFGQRVYEVFLDEGSDHPLSRVRLVEQKLVVGADGNRRRVTGVRDYGYRRPMTREEMHAPGIPAEDLFDPKVEEAARAWYLQSKESEMAGADPQLPELVTARGKVLVEVQLPRAVSAFRAERLDRLHLPEEQAAHIAARDTAAGLFDETPYSAGEHAVLMGGLATIDPVATPPDHAETTLADWQIW